MKKKTVIIGITGGIAAYKACDAINHLRKKRYNVICIMTREAEEFVTRLTLETLSGNKVYQNMFELPETREIAHISLAEKAGLIVICPATANIIAKLASGICDDLLTTTVISSEAPVLIAPAMNDKMYKNKITQRNIETLKKAGYKFIDPIRGRLACGNVGVGHLADLTAILKRIEKILK
jgi:phosphopantothenoylcysteine decarboxylase/phosphopantothenate--cysteine ligase